MQTKDVIQKEALLAWLDKSGVGSVILPTGTGKTRLGALAALHKSDEVSSILVVTSRIPLVDQWKETFEAELVPMEKVTFACVASAYKFQGHYDLIIVDEVHKTLSPQYRKLFTNVSYKYLLCLTATIPHKGDYASLLQSIAPIVYIKTLSDLKDSTAILAPFVVYNLTVPFESRMKGIYKVFDSKFTSGLVHLSSISKKFPELQTMSIFDIAKIHRSLPDDASPLVPYAKDFWTGMTMRKQAVYSNSEKIKVAIQIIARAPNSRRFMLFTKSISFAKKLHELLPESIIYHSKMPHKERKAVLDAYKERKFRHLIAVDALNEGLDVPDVDSAICLSGVSTELVSVQQLGRILRVSEDKPKAVFINLVTKDTVEQRWVKEKTDKLSNVHWIGSINDIKW